MTKKFENVNELRKFVSSLCFNNAVEAKEFFEEKIKRLEKEKLEIRDQLYELNCKMRQVEDWVPLGMEIDRKFDRLNDICNEVEHAKILIDFIEATETVCPECSGDKCLFSKDDEACEENKNEEAEKDFCDSEEEEYQNQAAEEAKPENPNHEQEKSELHNRPILRRVSIFIL